MRSPLFVVDSRVADDGFDTVEGREHFIRDRIHRLRISDIELPILHPAVFSGLVSDRLGGCFIGNVGEAHVPAGSRGGFDDRRTESSGMYSSASRLMFFSLTGSYGIS